MLVGFLGFTLMNREESKVVDIETKNKSVSECNLLENNQSKEMCYLDVAKTNGDSNICRMITDIRIRGDCYILTETSS